MSPASRHCLCRHPCSNPNCYCGRCCDSCNHEGDLVSEHTQWTITFTAEAEVTPASAKEDES